MRFFSPECALLVLSSKLRGCSAKQPTGPVKGAPYHNHLVNELLLHWGKFDTLIVVFQNNNVNICC